MAERGSKVRYRMLAMPCCGTQIHWIEDRWPTHCVECGQPVFPQIKECVVLECDAELILQTPDSPEDDIEQARRQR